MNAEIGQDEAEWRHVAAALAAALVAHRQDMHLAGDRPCSTCSQSTLALGKYDELTLRFLSDNGGRRP